MSERLILKYRPDLEPLEPKRLLSAGTVSAAAAHLPAEPTQAQVVSAMAVKPNFGYLVYRLTNPSPSTNTLKPPFGHVLVQGRQPVPGQVYNVLSVSLKNATNKTFTASDGFKVKLTEQRTWTPIITGNEVWKPGQDFIFYVLTKKYYPIKNPVTNGFQFDLGGAVSVAIPGPSGIFLRLPYNPATINAALNKIVTTGPGAEGGAGIATGIADTAIYAFVSATQHRNDFGGYF